MKPQCEMLLDDTGTFCLEDADHQCEDCGSWFCWEHGQKGGDRQVQDVGAVAYPSLCDSCLGMKRL